MTEVKCIRIVMSFCFWLDYRNGVVRLGDSAFAAAASIRRARRLFSAIGRTHVFGNVFLTFATSKEPSSKQNA